MEVVTSMLCKLKLSPSSAANAEKMKNSFPHLSDALITVVCHQDLPSPTNLHPVVDGSTATLSGMFKPQLWPASLRHLSAKIPDFSAYAQNPLVSGDTQFATDVQDLKTVCLFIYLSISVYFVELTLTGIEKRGYIRVHHSSVWAIWCW